MNDKQQVVDRLEGKSIIILSDDTIYSEVQRKVRFMFKGFEFEVEIWDKSDGEMGDYDNDLVINYEGKDVTKCSKFEDDFVEELYDAVEDELR